MKATAMDLYLHKDYRLAFQSRLKLLKATMGSDFSTQSLAETCGVQRTYLSKVLNRGAHLNDDQLFQALNFLKFSEVEKEYLILLHQFQRSAHHNRKLLLKSKIDEHRKNKLKADAHLQTKILDRDKLDIHFLKYYLSSYVQVAHMMLHLDEFQINPLKIKTSLDLTQKQCQTIIDKLFDLQLVEQRSNKLIAINSQFFISSESDLFESYHLTAKTQALSQLKKTNAADKNSCSMLFTCSEQSWLEIRALFVNFLKNFEAIVVNDRASTGVYQLSVDLFPWVNPKANLGMNND